MAEKMKVTPAQLMQMARQLKGKNGAQEEARQLEQLAQSGLSEGQQAQLHSVMQDKAKLAQLLESPQARALMEKLGGKRAD
ncbi:MAG: hypothetical protein LBG83_05300 [Oscillospiraceae bacterium]|nr:hypothetical protein [Oscillospiraceae bacterium]